MCPVHQRSDHEQCCHRWGEWRGDQQMRRRRKAAAGDFWQGRDPISNTEWRRCKKLDQSSYILLHLLCYYADILQYQWFHWQNSNKRVWFSLVGYVPIMYKITENMLTTTWVNSITSANLVYMRNTSKRTRSDILLVVFFLATIRAMRINAVMNASVMKRIVAKSIIWLQIFISQELVHAINTNTIDTTSKLIFHSANWRKLYVI